MIRAIFAFALGVSPALAHDSPVNGLKNRAGEFCCGEVDCRTVHAHHVTLPHEGYRVFEPAEFVPVERAQPSPDGQFWRCFWGGELKCFFVPFEAY